MNTIFSHRSIRKFTDQRVEKDILVKIVEAAVRASNTGNMQVYSVVVTTSKEILNELAPCHYNQPASQAPVQMTFCADFNRFKKWCELRDAVPGYDNFLSFLVGYGDAFLAAQNAALEAENQGLGVCYLGTVLYNAKKVIDILNLPKGVVPVATLVMGYPQETPELTSRLPLEAVLHWDKYQDFTPNSIDNIYSALESSEFTGQLLLANQKNTLAQVFTDNRYPQSTNESVSNQLKLILQEQGFWNL